MSKIIKAKKKKEKKQENYKLSRRKPWLFSRRHRALIATEYL